MGACQGSELDFNYSCLLEFIHVIKEQSAPYKYLEKSVLPFLLFEDRRGD